jgi:hypothetical protein
MKTNWKTGSALLGIATGIVLMGVAHAGQPAGKLSAAAPVAQSVEPMKTTAETDGPAHNVFRLLFEVIAVQLDDDQVKAWDGSPGPQSTAALLARACEEGRAQVIQSFDVPHIIRHPTHMTNHERVPYVTSVAETDQGPRTTVHHTAVSCRVSVTTDWFRTESGYEIGGDWQVHHNTMIDHRAIKPSEQVNSHILTELKQVFSTVQRPGETRVYATLTGRRTAPGNGEEAVLYVYRSTFLPLE